MPEVASFAFDPAAIARIRKNLLSRWRFPIVLLAKLPMGILAGLRVVELTDERCRVTVRYRWRNRNPFGSTYWAVLGMAAELAPGALVIQYTQGQTPSIATLVTGVTARFLKKAKGLTTFTSESGRAIAEQVTLAAASGESREFDTPVSGVDEDGQPIADFVIHWSIKVRQPK